MLLLFQLRRLAGPCCPHASASQPFISGKTVARDQSSWYAFGFRALPLIFVLSFLLMCLFAIVTRAALQGSSRVLRSFMTRLLTLPSFADWWHQYLALLIVVIDENVSIAKDVVLCAISALQDITLAAGGMFIVQAFRFVFERPHILHESMHYLMN